MAHREKNTGRRRRHAPVPEGTWALITGASQGLGRALAEECARRGLDVILVALPGSEVGRVAQEIGRAYGVRAACYVTDLTAPGSPEALGQWLADKGFAVSVLINNAGVGYNSRFEDSTLQENEKCILLNNLATVKLTHLLLPELRGHPSAFMLNVASLAAYFPMPFMAVYAPSKAFIVNFSLALREELRGTPLRVSALCPNGIRTNAACREKIAAGGLAARLTCMDAAQVARRAVRGMFAGRPVIIPGAINRALAGMSKFVPQSTISAVVANFWGRTARRREPVAAASEPPAARPDLAAPGTAEGQGQGAAAWPAVRGLCPDAAGVPG